MRKHHSFGISSGPRLTKEKEKKCKNIAQTITKIQKYIPPIIEEACDFNMLPVMIFRY